MRKEIGILAVMAFAFRLGMPGGKDASSAGDQTSGQGTAAVKTVKTSGAASIAGEIRPDGPWLATRPFFGSLTPAGVPHRPDQTELDFRDAGAIVECAGTESCRLELLRYFGVEETKGIEFAIATAPDPYHTRLSLATDGVLQTIEQAATDGQWEFATEWLPWNDSINPDEKDPAKRLEERRLLAIEERQPGLLVFRRRPSGGTFSNRTLLIWVVGERPTAGINAAQFQLARAYTQALGDPALVRIVGPTFSGSLDSLSRLLLTDQRKNPKLTYRIRGGTVTSVEARRAFRARFPDFESDGLDSNTVEAEFTEALNRLRIQPSDALVLAEDESEYGASVAPASTSSSSEASRSEAAAVGGSTRGGVRVIRFPRDISRLRNAFPEIKPGTDARAAVPDLGLSLKDNTAGEDSVPMFSGTQSPMEQDAFLNEVAQTIRRERIRLVQLSATNVLDTLFLARVLRQQCPDTRLLLLPPAHELFVQAARTATLNGMLAISPDPMSPYPETGAHELHPYADADAERLFTAARQLFQDGSTGVPVPKPEAWLLTLDRQGFLPVLVIHPHLADAVGRTFPMRTPSAAWILVATVLGLLSAGIVVWMVLLRRQPRLLVDARMDLAVRRQPDVLRLFYVFAFLLILGWMQAILWLPVINLPGWAVADTARFAAISSSLAVTSLLASVWMLKPHTEYGSQRTLSFLLPATTSRPAKSPIRNRAARRGQARLLMGFATATAVAGLWIWGICCFSSKNLAGNSFRYRAAELRPGSSPAWPVLLSGAALLLYCFVQLTRVYLATCQAPTLVTEHLSKIFKQRMCRSYRELNRSLSSLLGFWYPRQRTWFGYGLGLLLTLSAIWRVDLKLSSVNSRGFDVLVIAMQMAVLAAVLLTTWHVAVIWRHLKTLLAALSDLPLAQAFIRADRSGGNQPMWVRRLNLQSLDGHTQSAVILHDLGLTALDRLRLSKRLQHFSDKYIQLLGKLLDPSVPDGPAASDGAVSDRLKTRAEVLRQHKDLRRCNWRVASCLLREVLHPHWHSSKLVQQLHESGKPGEVSVQRNPYEIQGAPACEVNLAEAFVALHCSAYLTYGVRQIQNLILFLSLGYALLTLSLNSYAPQAPQAIGKVLIVLFVIIAVTLWNCMSGIERNPILSRIAGTTAGELNKEFYFKMAAYVALPLLGVLASEFPSISNMLFSWLQPALESLK